MSGHTNYTLWIENKANYLIVNNKKEIIIDTFFTSNQMPNSDIFNIKTEKSVYEFGDKGVDWNELRKRYK